MYTCVSEYTLIYKRKRQETLPDLRYCVISVVCVGSGYRRKDYGRGYFPWVRGVSLLTKIPTALHPLFVLLVPHGISRYFILSRVFLL